MRAKPLITRGVMAAIAVLPAAALALGLGRLTVDSGFGQPLSARVELTAVQKDDLDSLTAKVADPSVYRDNNVQYPSAVAHARVTVEQGPNNVSYLRVSTQQAVNEPFLDLIVEVNWATGRVVRNYTFLLDPPGVAEKQAAEPIAPVRPARAAAAPARGGQPDRGAAAASGRAAAAGGDTYTVQRGDTLAKIALQYKPAEVTLDQMLVALFRSNEGAFDGKNMNRLRSGQILTIPSAEKRAQVGPAEAQQVVRLQAADWRAYRDRVAAAAPTTQEGPSRQAAGGRITAAEEKGAEPRPGQDRLRVSREAGKSVAVGAAASEAEELAAKDKALREANTRIADLEKTLRDMQKAVELKSQTMADAQKQAEAAKVEPPKAAAGQVAPPVATAPVGQAPAEPAPSAAAPAGKAPEAGAPEAKAPESKAPEAKAGEAETKPAETKAPAKPPEPKAAAKAAKAAPQPQPSFFEELMASVPTWAIGLGALVILGGIAAIIAGRRRKTTKFEDSIISGTDIKTNTVFGSTGGGVVNTGDNSLASDFSRQGLGSIDTDEVDPIAEAEVYLAYGRDAQAEEILKEALKKDPQRQEIYLKVLEIHAQHNKPSAFETVASELYTVSGGKGEVWQKAMALGRQLDPNNPLFTDAGGAAGFAAAAAAGSEQPAAAPHEEAPAAAPAATPRASEPKAEPPSAKPVDFALDEDISISPTSLAAPEPKTPASILAGAAQEVAKSTRTSGGAEARPAPAQGVSFGPESVPKFDLDFNLDEPSRPGPPMAPVPPRPAPKAPAPEAGTPAQLARPAAAVELDKLDLAFDPERSTFEDPTPSVLDGQWHDAATKLDLAKAYQEMGDVEGAREILQEVLHEGDDQQKAEAESLLSKLS